MSKIELDTITSGHNLSKINDNFQKVENELNNNVLYRQDNPTEPNHMSTNLDMNSKRILNLQDATDFSEPVTLRQLLEIDSGDALSFTQIGSGATLRLAQDKMRERVTPKDFGAIGDGIADDTSKFATLESNYLNRGVDLCGLTYLVTVIPTGNTYFNGSFKVGTDIFKAVNEFIRNNSNVVHSIGKSAELIPDNYDLPEVNRFQLLNGSFAAGNAASKITKMGQTIAIGGDAMGETLMSWDNVAIGEASLQNIQGEGDEYTATLTGSRNVAVGGNTGQFMTTGQQCVLVGRNVGTSFVTNAGTTAIGAGAMAGGGANGGWTTAVENWFPNTFTTTAGGCTAMGLSSAKSFYGDRIVSYGGNSGVNVKKGNNNTLFGYGSGFALEEDLLPNGHTQVIPAGAPAAATYVKTGSNLVITFVGHSAVVGQRVMFNTTSGVAQTPGSHGIWETVLAADATTFTVNCPLPGDGAGNAVIYTFDTGVDGQFCGANVAMGTDSLRQAKLNTSNNTVIGHSAGYNIDNSSTNTIVGSTAGFLQTSMSASTLIGWNSGNLGAQGVPSLTQCTFIGGATGYKNIDNSVPASYTNVSILGYGAVVSGNNQVQLGNSATTTYVYGTVQNRSDARDKTDIQDTQLGIDFIMGLRPVDGRWDLRDDYYEEYEVQVGTDPDTGKPILETRSRPVAKDGSKKRVRLHHWFIAQEVKELCDKLGVEFGGYQDHSINDGSDALSLGYDEFIPPLTKAVQDCWKEIEIIKSRLDAAGL